MSSSTTASEVGDEAPSAIRVLVRVRPLNDREAKSKSILQLQSGETTAIDFGIKDQAAGSLGEEPSSACAEGTVTIVDQPGSSFTYDAVFGPESNQIDIFDSVKGLVESVLSGYNGTIVAYGMTSSGKTHTIFGEESASEYDDEAAGLVQRSLKAIFQKMNGSKDGNSSSQQHTAKASFFEIYNEKVYDLLSSNNNMLQESLAVREDSSKGVYVEGLMEHDVHDTAGAMDVLRVGNDNRRVASTSMNRVSSRSHAVFVLTVKNVITNDLDGTSKVLESKFTLVDLAGSERQKTTDAAGERLKEASMINNSLLCLGQVINSLVDREKGKERHVPFRDSKLTFLLRDSWGGNSKTCLVATVTPSATSISETISTLKFAQRAKLVKNTAVKNETYSVAALQMEIARLKSELEQRNNNVISGDAAKSSSFAGSSGSDSIDRVTISSLRDRNSTLNEKVRVLKDQSNLMGQQVNSLKRKLQQEIMIRKCKERRITYLASKANDEGTEKEAITNLQIEVNTLREQLESKQNPESIHWMMKYKEEKVKLEQILKANATALDEVNDQAELYAHLECLLDDKEALEKQIASMRHGRHSEVDQMSKDVAKLEKEIVFLKSQLSKKDSTVLHYKAEITAINTQIRSLDKDRIEALEFLETVNSELVAEQKKVAALQASVDKMSQLIQENENNATDWQLKEAAQQGELNDAKAQLQSLQKELNDVKEDNCSLIKNLNDVTNDVSVKEAEVAHLKRENNEALARFNLQQKEGSDKLGSLQAQLLDKDQQIKSILCEKTELEESVVNLTSQNASAMAENELLKKRGVEWQERVDSVEDKLSCTSKEKEQVEEELSLVRENLKRNITLQEEYNARLAAAHNIDLVRRDEEIKLLRSEKDALKVKLHSVDKNFQEQIQILQEECDNVKQKEKNLLSTLDALTDGYDTLRTEKDNIEKELKETKKLLKKSTSKNEELESNSEVKSSEIEATKHECEVLKKKQQQLLSDLAMAIDTSSQLQSEKFSLEEELVATKTLLENSSSTNAELESSNTAKAVEMDTLKVEFQAAKEKELQLLSEMESLKTVSSNLQLEKEAVQKDLAETKALLENAASKHEELERSTAERASEMDASLEALNNQVLRLSDENEAAKVFETQVSELTRDNRSHHATIEKLRLNLSETESAKMDLDKISASKMNEMKEMLTIMKDDHAAEVNGLKQEAESLKAELKEMKELIAGTKEQHKDEIERLNNEIVVMTTKALDKEESIVSRLKETEEREEKMKGQHAIEIERLRKEVDLAETEAISKEEIVAKSEMALASLKQEHASEKDRYAKELESMNREAEALKCDAIDADQISAAKLSAMEAEAASRKDEYASEIDHLKQQAEAARTELMSKEEINAVEVNALKEIIQNMKVKHAGEIEALKLEIEGLKAEAAPTDTTLKGGVSEDNVNDTTFDEDDDFDEDMFLPNVDIEPDSSEIVTDHPASPKVDSAGQTVTEVTDSAASQPTVVAENLDENSPLSPSMTPFKERREIFANRTKQNTVDEEASPKKPPTRRSRRNTASKTEQTPVQRVTRKSTRLSTARTPFTDLQDSASSSTRKVRTNFQRGALD